MEIFVIHREFVDGHIDIAGPAFTTRANAETHRSELLTLEEVQEAIIHSVYVTLNPSVHYEVEP
jgi:hypothetical protein